MGMGLCAVGHTYKATVEAGWARVVPNYFFRLSSMTPRYEVGWGSLVPGAMSMNLSISASSK